MAEGFLKQVLNWIKGKDEDIDTANESEKDIKNKEKETSFDKTVPADKRPMPTNYGSKPVQQNSSAAAPKTSTDNLHQTNRFSKNFDLLIMYPESFNESSRLVDNLKAKKPVIVSFSNLDTEVARKIFDFLSGATYALNGTVKKVSDNIFVFSPDSVDVIYDVTVPKQIQENE